MTRPVYVAAMGAVSPLAPTWAETMPLLMTGASAVRPVTHFDVSGFPSTAAAWIGDDAVNATGDRRSQWVHAAADEIAEQVELERWARRDRIGVFLGAESGRASPAAVLALARAGGGGLTFDQERFGRAGRPLASSAAARAVSPAAASAALAGHVGARGPVHTISLACASGASAILGAVRQLRLGHCDAALAGGVGADVDPFMLVGFGRLGALSARGVSRPFDQQRDGFVVGEGAALVLLTTAPTGLAVPVTGVGASLDGYHLTAPEPDGTGAARAMHAALRDAGRSTVDVVQAHGTSTPLNDAAESRAVRRVFGSATDRIWTSSVKGALGHWIAGAGALGFLCAVEAVRGRVVPTAGLTSPDPDCPLRHVMGGGLTDVAVGAAMINSFAFGGANCSLIVEAAA